MSNTFADFIFEIRVRADIGADFTFDEIASYMAGLFASVCRACEISPADFNDKNDTLMLQLTESMLSVVNAALLYKQEELEI